MSATEPQEADLPKAVLKRMIKAKLQEVDTVRGGDGTRDFQVNKDALLAFGEAGKLFIHYLTATANDICKDAKRQTISADDVMTALNDLEFDEFVEPLKKCLEGKLGVKPLHLLGVSGGSQDAISRQSNNHWEHSLP